MSESGKLEADPLFLGLTRPPMLFGVGYNLVMANFLLNILYFILDSTFYVFLSFIALHGVGYVLTTKEPLFMEMFIVRQSKCNKCSNRLFHGLTNSYDIM